MVEDCVRRFGLQAVDLVFEQIILEPFSLGQNKTGFQANFQYIFKPANFQQYLERAQLRRKKQSEPQQKESAGGVIEEPEKRYRLSKDEYERDMRQAAAAGNKHAMRLVEQWDKEKTEKI